MKKSLILAGLLISSVNTYAVEAQRFLFGVNYSSGSGELEESINTTTSTNEFDTSSTSFKVGYTLENDNRFVFSYEIMQKEFKDSSFTWYGENKPEVLFYNFDWQFTYPNENFAPYWTIGLAGTILENSASYFSDGEDLQGVSFNYGVGFIYSVKENIELELAYKCKSIGWENVSTNNTQTVSKVGQVEVGINLLF